MTVVDLIIKKRDKQIISEKEFDLFIKGILDKSIKDYQISAFLMAIYLNGLNDDETYYLTKAMTFNGEVLNYKDIDGPIIDKHSTGGIGDKVTLILAPLLASFNLKVAKMSGRGLGYTGGTVDKIESFGAKTVFPIKEYLEILKKNNIFIIAQSDKIAPSDKIIYAIRDTSGTVNNLSLMASSIMSKKLATNAERIYLDVKVGDGSFFNSLVDAKKFSKMCINIGKRFNKKVIVHLTNMNKPLGRCLGNLIEVKETINFLLGNFESTHLKEIIYEFASDILIDNKIANSKDQAYKMIDEKISSKDAYKKFKEWAKSQKSTYDFDNINDLYKTKYTDVIVAKEDGYIDFKSNKEFGLVLIDLKAGRKNKEEKLDFLSGIYLNKTFNEYVEKGKPIITIYSSLPITSDIISRLNNNIIYNKKKLKEEKNIIGVIE
ncbi:thymidine phosphorylase [Malacoplasma muris]|uniref:thymidine phosphorylase n=1 Tax=Malacoplasma muris TaxID=2119 RepID=UPI00398E50FB